jgi:hypothetical protein
MKGGFPSHGLVVIATQLQVGGGSQLGFESAPTAHQTGQWQREVYG